LQEREQVRSSLMSKVLGENMSPSTPQVPKHLHSTREHVAARPFPFFLDGHPGVARKSIPRKEHLMSNLQYTRGLVSFISAALILPSLALAQSQITTTQVDQPNRVAVAYVPPKNPDFQELYLLLSGRLALEKMQGILSPLRLPEELTIKTAECGRVNAWCLRPYTRTSFHHQPEAQHPKSFYPQQRRPDYPIFRGVKRTSPGRAAMSLMTQSGRSAMTI
jgi:hypothetical protein